MDPARVGLVRIPIFENHLIIHKILFDPVKDFIVGSAVDFEVGRHALAVLRIWAAADGLGELRAAITLRYTYDVIKMVSDGL